MRIFWCLVLFIVIGIIRVSYILAGANSDVSSQEARMLEAQNQDVVEIEQNTVMTYLEKQRVLLLKQDYQGALDLMPQAEKEMLAKESPEVVLANTTYTYSYLYMALGRDEDALQKVMEYKFPKDKLKDTDFTPEVTLAVAVLEFQDYCLKVTIMSRLNMTDEIINETNAILDVYEHVFKTDAPLCYTMTLSMLIGAQLVKGDLESVQKNINRCREFMKGCSDLMKGFSVPASFEQQYYAYEYESFAMIEYFMKNLTKTHSARFEKEAIKPPRRNAKDPNKCDIETPRMITKIISKTDNVPFTIDDFRRATAKPLHDPFLEQQPTTPTRRSWDD